MDSDPSLYNRDGQREQPIASHVHTPTRKVNVNQACPTMEAKHSCLKVLIFWLSPRNTCNSAVHTLQVSYALEHGCKVLALGFTLQFHSARRATSSLPQNKF